MLRRFPFALFVLTAVCTTTTVFAAPRIGLVVTRHDGLTDEQSDEIAYDVAGSIATQIEGEAIAGPTVRELLPEGVPPGCEDDPVCGRKIAKQLKTDEVLFLSMKKAQKKDVTVTCHRVARDPDRIPTDAQLKLAGNKSKRGRAVSELVTGLYPAGSVIAFTEKAPAPPPRAVVDNDQEEEAQPTPRRRKSSTGPVYKKAWFWGVLAGGVVVVAGAAVGIGFATQPGPSAPSLELPP